MEEAFSTRYLLAILPQLIYVLMRSCHVHGRNSVPCPVVNKLTGAVVCCQAVEDTTQIHVGESLGASNIVQHSAGYIQPILIRTCNEQSCSSQSTKHTVYNCTQNWKGQDLYTEDPLYNGYMHLEKVLIPDGCRCLGKDETKESLESGSSFYREESDFEIRTSTSIPISSNNGFPGAHRTGEQTPMDYSKSARYNVKRQAIPTNAGELGLDNPYPLGTRIPSSTLVKYNISSYKDDGPSDLQNLLSAYLTQNLPLVSLGEVDGEYNFNDSEVSRNDLVKALRGLVDNSPANDDPFTNSTFQNISSSCSNGENCSSSKNTSTYPTLDLSSGGPQKPTSLLAEHQGGLDDTVKSSQLVNLNVDQANFLNMMEVMKYNLKMGLLGGTFGRMTTAEIMKNILTYVPEDEQAHIQSTAEKMMETEMNYLQTSLKMMEILSNFTGSLDPAKSALNFLFNFNDSSKDPLISRPGINNPERFDSVDDPISNTSLPQGNQENVENIQEDLALGTNQSKVDVASVGSFPAVVQTPQVPSESRLRMVDRMEEELHSAFANFIFQEAWSNLNCTVPDQITQSVSEVRFLPPLIKKEFNLMAKGLLDINKFTGRLISGIIMCHIPDLEEALKDGRLMTAISGGVMAAELLNQQVKIVKGVMQGILDTSDAKKIASILRWSVQSTTGPSRREFLNLQDETRIDSLQKTLNNSLSEYVEFLKSKTSSDRVLSNLSSDFSSSSVSDTDNLVAFTEELNKNENRLPGISPVVVSVSPPSGTTSGVNNGISTVSNKPLLPEITQLDKFTTPTSAPVSFNSGESNQNVFGVNETTAAAPKQDTVNGQSLVFASATASSLIQSENVSNDTLVSKNGTSNPNIKTDFTLSLLNLTESSSIPESDNTDSTNRTLISSGTISGIPASQVNSAVTEASSGNKINLKVDTLKTNAETTDTQSIIKEYEYIVKKEYEYKDYEYNDYGVEGNDLQGGSLKNETSLGTNKILKNIANFNKGEKVNVDNATDNGEGPQESKLISGVGPLIVDYSYKDDGDYPVSNDYEDEKGIFSGKDDEDGSNDRNDSPEESNGDKFEEYGAERDITDNVYGDGEVDDDNEELSRTEKVGELTPNKENQYTNDEKKQNSKEESKHDEYALGIKESDTKYSYNEVKSSEDSTTTTTTIASVRSEEVENIEEHRNDIIEDELEYNFTDYGNDQSDAANSEEDDKHTDIGGDHVHLDKNELRVEEDEEGESGEISHNQVGSGDENPVADKPASATGDLSSTSSYSFVFEDDIDLPEEYNPIDMSPINLQMLFTNLNV